MRASVRACKGMGRGGEGGRQATLTLLERLEDDIEGRKAAEVCAHVKYAKDAHNLEVLHKRLEKEGGLEEHRHELEPVGVALCEGHAAQISPVREHIHDKLDGKKYEKRLVQFCDGDIHRCSGLRCVLGL